MKKVLFVALISASLVSCMPDTGGKVPGLDNMINQNNENVKAAVTDAVKSRALDSMARKQYDVMYDSAGSFILTLQK